MCADHLEGALWEAKTSHQVIELARQELRRQIGVSGAFVVALVAGVPIEDSVAVYSSESDPWKLASILPDYLGLIEETIAPWPELFGPAYRLFDANRRLEPGLLNTRLYQGWREHRIERQLLSTMGTAADPLGLMSVSRRRAERPFTKRDLERMGRIHRAVERALIRFARFPHGTYSAHDVISALDDTLPVPCGLFSEDGRVRWLNQEARLRLGLLGSHGFRWPMYGRSHSALSTLTRFVRAVSKDATVASRFSDRDGIALLLPGEQLVVKHHATPGNRPMVLLSVLPPSGSRGPAITPSEGGLKRLGLTAREADVVRAVVEGLTLKQVADAQSISATTVAAHLKSVYRKLDVHSRVELLQRVLGACSSW